jgi:F-type H+-transporting ATPase subunit delta
MSHAIIARRYAQALLGEAMDRGSVDAADADMAMIRRSLADSDELRRFFTSPIISRDKKASIVRALFGGRVSDLTLRFMLMMVDKQREHIFSEVSDAYARIRDEQLGIENVSARIARPMPDDEERELRESIERFVGKRVRLSTTLDSSLVGGVIVRVGDTLYDGSISNQLRSLRERLESGRRETNHG